MQSENKWRIYKWIFSTSVSRRVYRPASSVAVFFDNNDGQERATSERKKWTSVIGKGLMEENWRMRTEEWRSNNNGESAEANPFGSERKRGREREEKERERETERESKEINGGSQIAGISGCLASRYLSCGRIGDTRHSANVHKMSRKFSRFSAEQSCSLKSCAAFLRYADLWMRLTHYLLADREFCLSLSLCI